jgi:integrase
MRGLMFFCALAAHTLFSMEELIAQVIDEERHATGTKARLAYSLLLFTGARRSDVVRLGRQHVRDNV